MFSTTVLLILIFLAFATAFILGVFWMDSLSDRYREKFNREVHRNLSDMFIFVDIKEVYIINVAVLLIAFLLTWLMSGNPVVALLVAVLLGMAPKFIWTKLRERRERRFLKELPDAVTSLATMMRSGATLPVSLELVVTESKGPVSEEFGLFLRELTVGVDYQAALDNLSARMPVEELQLVTAAMKISREVGGSLADVLYRLGETIRRKLEMEGKIRALTAQGKAQGWVMTLLPVFMALALFKLEPEAMSYLFTSWPGWIACAVFALCISLGYFFIKKIVTIDV